MHEEKIVKEIAAERAGRLISLAYDRTMEKGRDGLSARYVRLAREISSHYKVRMKRQEKNLFCKACNSILIPGKTCTVTLASSRGQVVYKCRCGADMKISYK